MQEKEYFDRIMAENARNKALKLARAEKERKEDQALFEQKVKMLEKQDQDRKNEIIAREQRAQAFMNRLADTVLKDMDVAQRKEEENIAKYVLEKEKKMRRADAKKAKAMAKTKEEIKMELHKQSEDKIKRQMAEKSNLNE